VTADWEVYFALLDERDDLVNLELNDMSDEEWDQIYTAAHILGQSVEEFLQVVLHEVVTAKGNWDRGYGGSHNSITGTGHRSCFVCEQQTVYVDINFEAHICGGICEWAAWEAYGMALRERNPWRVQHAA
jgi:hypothetical protein